MIRIGSVEIRGSSSFCRNVRRYWRQASAKNVDGGFTILQNSNLPIYIYQSPWPQVEIYDRRNQDGSINVIRVHICFNHKLYIHEGARIVAPQFALYHEIGHAASYVKNPIAYKRRRQERAAGNWWKNDEEYRCIMEDENAARRAFGVAEKKEFCKSFAMVLPKRRCVRK